MPVPNPQRLCLMSRRGLCRRFLLPGDRPGRGGPAAGPSLFFAVELEHMF